MLRPAFLQGIWNFSPFQAEDAYVTSPPLNRGTECSESLVDSTSYPGHSLLLEELGLSCVTPLADSGEFAPGFLQPPSCASFLCWFGSVSFTERNPSMTIRSWAWLYVEAWESSSGTFNPRVVWRSPQHNHNYLNPSQKRKRERHCRLGESRGRSETQRSLRDTFSGCPESPGVALNTLKDISLDAF